MANPIYQKSTKDKRGSDPEKLEKGSDPEKLEFQDPPFFSSGYKQTWLWVETKSDHSTIMYTEERKA
jgi:hypothetical protein